MRLNHPAVRVGLLCALLAGTACGTRMDRADVALAERGGLDLAAATSQTTAPTGADALAAPATADPSAAAPVAGDTSTAAPSLSAPASGAVTAPAGTSSAAAPTRSATAAPGQPAAAATATPGKAAAPGQAAPATAPGKASAAPAPGQPAPAPGQAAPAAPVKGNEVALGTVATLSGPVGAFVKDSISALQVWAKSINARGGLNGHPVKYITADDGADPARYNALVRQLAEEQKVAAFLFNTLGFAGGDLSYVNQKRIPIIGHEGGTELGYASPMVFTPFPSGDAYAYTLIAGLADVVIPDGKKKLATIACSDVKLCDIFDKAWNGPYAKELGFENVYRARASLTQPDYTAECLAAKQAGAEVIIAAVDNNSYLRLDRSCARQGFEPVIGIADQLALPSLAADETMEGNVVSTKVAPWPATSIPGIAELHQVYKSFAPGVEVNGSHPAGWLIGKIMEEASKSFTKPDVVPEDVLNGLWSIKDNNMGGLTFPLTFTRDQPSPRKSCWGSVLITGKKFTAPFGAQFKCRG
jgi:ABC-type branched-subunit amino acid transport system substrate-binding protein